VLASQLAHLGLGHSAERKQGAAQLLLREAKEKIRLIFDLSVGASTASDYAVGRSRPARSASGNVVGANLPRHNQKLVKLQVIVAETARNGRAAGKILLDDGRTTSRSKRSSWLTT